MLFATNETKQGEMSVLAQQQKRKEIEGFAFSTLQGAGID